jgi:hypothetical protein
MMPVFFIARFHPGLLKYWWWTTSRQWSPNPADARAYHSAPAAQKRAEKLTRGAQKGGFFEGCGDPTVINPYAPMPKHRTNKEPQP